MKGTIGLVDADVLIYHSAFACQKHYYTFDGKTFPDHKSMVAWMKENGVDHKVVEYEKHLDVLPEAAFYSICNRLLYMIQNKLDGAELQLYVSGETNFRTDIATFAKYKGNRDKAEKPVYYDMAKVYWTEKSTGVSVGEEADDVLGIMANYLQKANWSPVVCSIDKDLDMIPGRHYNWDKQLLYEVDADTADWWFWMQMLMGDTADNIPGVKGYGPKKAEKALEDLTPKARREVVEAIYRKAWGQLWEKAMTEIGQLLWMRRNVGEMWSLDQHPTLAWVS